MIRIKLSSLSPQVTACTANSTATQPSLPLPPSSRLTNLQISKGSKEAFLTTMKKRTKKSLNEVNQSNSPPPPGSLEGGLRSRAKSELEALFNKFSNKLSSKPPSRSTSLLSSTSTGNPLGETLIGKYSISSGDLIDNSISDSSAATLQDGTPQLSSHRSGTHRSSQIIAHCQHRRFRLLLEWFKVSYLAAQCHSSD